MKVCLISSTGGHFDELLKIVPAVKDYDYFIVTEHSQLTLGAGKDHKVLYLRQQERKDATFVFTFLINIFRSFRYYLKERPKIVVTTGAGAALPMCLIGMIFGSKIVCVESYAKIFTPSMTGRLLYKIADEFYIQWEELAESYPKAKYKGALY
ncbi:PssD/Cps14F family polysaccharide biosynthesis glycosyltransferase [Paenibacillus soyae]|uniref:UDP-N-acetylglucosamine transferase subunit ALG14 n=1 Tax=Paenibacillus soyae TaxID=2969249 RepID=A0A9X2SB76_9BACL|nr:PssD/Cps14F family polysaccharide biosynthesis glycosyltransferase [Paenibacillus soyae]MCR2807394.1 UDP-N-acetylglucosamine transferase subunit ALG14 [Paenibacillus soyae]